MLRNLGLRRCGHEDNELAGEKKPQGERLREPERAFKSELSLVVSRPAISEILRPRARSLGFFAADQVSLAAESLALIKSECGT